MKRTIIRFVCLLIILGSAHIAGCGGGGGGTPAVEPVSINSLDGKPDVAANSIFRYVFPQPINTSRVTRMNFFIVPAAAADVTKAAIDPSACNPANALAASVSCFSPMQQCELTPDSDLNGVTRYSICLTTGITYSNGQPFQGFMATFSTAKNSYSIGGTVSGLDEGDNLVLQNNGAENLTISSNGAFAFSSQLANGAAYAVSVFTAPTHKTCTVGSGTGTISNADVTNVSVVCSTSSYAVGGTVSGLAGSGLVLQNNAGDDLGIAADGAFTFATKVASGAAYAVTVKTQPASPSQLCTVTNGSGTITDADVTNVNVECISYILPTTATDVRLGTENVLVDGNKVYTIEGTKFNVIDVSNPLSPSLLGTVDHGFTDARVEAQAIYNNIVWCVRSSTGGSGSATYVFGVDVSNPTNPVVRGSLTLQTNSSLLANVSLIYAGYWLVQDYSRNLIYVIDISNPDAPAKYSQWSVPSMVNGGPGPMMIEGTLLYLPCGEAKVFNIYDLADLTNVTLLGSVPTTGECHGTAVKIGSYVYLTTDYNESNMKVIDVSNPANPTIVRNVAIVSAYNFKGRNGKLFSFACDNTSTVRAYSLANPIVPVEEASSTVPAPAPSTSLGLCGMAYPQATWVGNYLIGMTNGSLSPQYDGARALDFTVN